MVRSKGYVTVFISLVLVIMIVVVLVVLEVCDRNHARIKMSTALSSAMSSELANYNRYIYDRYHILLLDTHSSGGSEGAMEQSVEDTLNTDLTTEYKVESVELTNKVYITDNNCKEFKKQIKENFKYEAAENIVEKIMDKAEGNDSPVDEEMVEGIDEDIKSRQEEIEISEEESKDDKKKKKKSKKDEEDVTDPRETLKTYTDAGIASLLLPSDVTFKEEELALDKLPSGGNSNDENMMIDTTFSDKDHMEADGLKSGGWGSLITDKAGSLSYANEYFNSLTEHKYDDTCLNLEKEYLIAGKSSDGENYKAVVNEILVIRFGFNFGYIVTDTAKMGECEALAAALTVEFPPLEPVVKYLLAGCWSYIESVADVYMLLRNHKIPYIKDVTSWRTDFESLAHLEELSEEADEEQGLAYNDYLIILAGMQGDKLELRMLDLIQENTKRNSDKSFMIKNCITSFGINTDFSYKGRHYSYHEETGY
ncbi:hypothetical protein SAMN06297422_1307 [Lachnospiraceae bacterium]|nr:hypothetical protein SAMN06297422_1307 [Lachnospiraceae bacterium]